jgi:HPt (histidine-containing phosphotransfer) domain-containing protein
MQVLIDELRIMELKRLFAKTNGSGLHEFITAFKESAEIAVTALTTPLENTTLESLRIQAHRLKGASLNLGAPALAELATKLEIHAKMGDRLVCIIWCSEIRALHEKTIIELNEILKKIV